MIGNYELTEAAKKTTSKDFGLASEITPIDEIIGIYENNNLFEQEMSIDLLKWRHMNNLNTFNYFTIEYILAYVLEFIIVERWANLDTDQSKNTFKKILTDLENSFQFSKDFNINEKRR